MNVSVTVRGGELSAKEQAAYIDYLENKHNRILDSLDIEVDGEFVDLHYKFQPVGFERIRRITGYLVGTMDNWNGAKAAEERDRVKHAVEPSGLEII